MPGFELLPVPIDLPPGGAADTERRVVAHDGKVLLGITQGRHRSYLYPVLTRGGCAVTEESPADHPHHNSIWIGADHVRAEMAGGRAVRDEATYAFFFDDVFQGRAPGAIRERSLEASHDGDDLVLEQRLDWRGPPEWGAPGGRVVLVERRVTRVRLDDRAYALDVASTIAATDWSLVIGPTRHALFGVRLAEPLCYGGSLVVTTEDGATRPDAVCRSHPRQVDLTGTAPDGRRAGVTIVRSEYPADWQWFVTDWGVVTLNPFGDRSHRLVAGDTFTASVTFVVHDGTAGA